MSLWHEMVIKCLLQKKGSSITVSKEEAMIILTIKKNLKIILDKRRYGLWKHVNGIFKFKKLKVHKHAKCPQCLKMIGEMNLKLMNINVRQVSVH